MIPQFGGHRLDEITPKMVADYPTHGRRDRHRKGGTRKAADVVASVNRELCGFKVLLRTAVEWGILDQNPTAGVKTSKETPQTPRMLESGEVTALLASLPDRLRGLVGCAVYAGLRRAELSNLRWEDIDLKIGEITVVFRQEHHTKNYQSRRIPMNEPLMELLRRHPRPLTSAHVFGNREGGMTTCGRGSTELLKTLGLVTASGCTSCATPSAAMR